MNNNLWFRAKKYGWGWYPVSWQGWLTIIIWACVFSTASVMFGKNSNTTNQLYYLIFIIISVFILIYICYKKGEKPGWRWDGK